MACITTENEENQAPVAVRGCTDVFWLILYITFWLLMIVVAVFAFVYGNPLRLINGYDSFGNTCGVKNNEKFSNIQHSGLNTLDKPYLFFLDIHHLRRTLKICVKECPSMHIDTKEKLYNYYKTSQTQLCRYDFDMSVLLQPDRKDIQLFDFLGPCPVFPVYKGTPVMHRCIPTGINNTIGHNIYDILNSWSAAQQLLSDLYTTWPFIALMCFGALVLSIIVIALMHWLTSIISWLICAFVAVASIAITGILWWTYYKIRNNTDEKHNILEEYIKNESAIYVLAIIATVVMIFLIILIYFLRSKLSGLAALFEEAGKCMFELPGISGPPLLAFIALAIFLAFWVGVVVCLITANFPGMEPLLKPGQNLAALDMNSKQIQNMPKKTNDFVDSKSLALVEYYDVNWLRNMFWIYFIGLIWTSEFIFACQQLAIAGAVAFWYFRKPTDSPVLHSISKLIKYHLGSVAKGSLLITIFKIPRLILTYLYAKLKRGDDKGSECASCGLKCCICCFWFLEKFIRYLNHNTYTVIAIESKNFCPAAVIAWNALTSNALSVATINGIGDLILFLGKLAVAAVCGLVSILVLRDSKDVYFYIIPCVFITVFAFFIAHVVLSLYEIVVDTLFLCVCEDRKINGTNGRWRESNLAQLLGEEPVDEPMAQTIELRPINKEPFSS